jgi:hypothetical protein
MRHTEMKDVDTQAPDNSTTNKGSRKMRVYRSILTPVATMYFIGMPRQRASG